MLSTKTRIMERVNPAANRQLTTIPRPHAVFWNMPRALWFR